MGLCRSYGSSKDPFRTCFSTCIGSSGYANSQKELWKTNIGFEPNFGEHCYCKHPRICVSDHFTAFFKPALTRISFVILPPHILILVYAAYVWRCFWVDTRYVMCVCVYMSVYTPNRRCVSCRTWRTRNGYLAMAQSVCLFVATALGLANGYNMHVICDWVSVAYILALVVKDRHMRLSISI